MKVFIKRERIVATVTDYYLDVIAEGLRAAGHRVELSYDWEDMDASGTDMGMIIGATRAPDMWKRKLPYLYWAQGIWPEESMMRHGSRLRFLAQSWLERQALKRAKFVFFVSDAMKQHYEKKYRLSFEGRCYIMPCANEALHPQSFATPGKYTDNVFCYAGGLAAWQCFEETVELYAKIEQQVDNARLLLLVKERDTALETLKRYGVQNYEINFVPREELAQVLKGVKFGFVLRNESPVNRVATPTKVLTYLANGLIPIYSDCLQSVGELLDGSQYCVAYHNDGSIDDILDRIHADIHAGEVRKDFETIYHTHYQSQRHIERICAHFQAGLEP